jgi:hypothetical protein
LPMITFASLTICVIDFSGFDVGVLTMSAT